MWPCCAQVVRRMRQISEPESYGSKIFGSHVLSLWFDFVFLIYSQKAFSITHQLNLTRFRVNVCLILSEKEASIDMSAVTEQTFPNTCQSYRGIRTDRIEFTYSEVYPPPLPVRHSPLSNLISVYLLRNCISFICKTQMLHLLNKSWHLER